MTAGMLPPGDARRAARPSRGGGARDGYQPRALGAAQSFGRLVFGVAFDLDVCGQELVPTQGPALLVGNHSGFLDGPIVVVSAPRPVRALTKAELYRGPLGGALTLIGQIPVRRGLPDRVALYAGARELAAGGAVAIFPEGTRSGGDLHTVHRGVGWLALRSGAPIVPVACVGTDAALPKGSHRPRWRTPVKVAYGTPFTLPPVERPHTSVTLSVVTEEIRRRLAAHVQSVRERADRG